ncbi:hypothetical protein KL905_003838 [Ogataea polymorpha]|uniref:Uncharacterized protein n=1 Tax=Ogataea polymorpha TaxID=460523 RepID=A0A1B7SFE6_9ASCO|nr:uncharacterized protein OGAPODRAFT_95012 [Ogataea polymorpha]KAG7878321.1 hypothetical protein KL937_004063 [Ogataea polymorpha]KAG7890162.1 hypothetical protein KL908_004500 [Ogataea polymorpha]KAG7901643.1 hypothetical protein KL907_004313 [Ogataea polymorpha]KAG7907141.1 hypothetical protein KL906_004327 [Ogataea polymorpha]KAG7914791.1 hypothetical protein KL927_004460 [Ogataea polymorpha]
MDYHKVYSYASDELLAPETLCFALFYVGVYKNEAEIRTELGQLKHYLDVELRPYIDHYPWHVRPPNYELVHDKHCFLYGELEYGENMDDLWVVASLLFKFTSRSENIYLHLYDQDREFLLIEAAHQVPGWLEPECASNRIWINTRRVVCIPKEYCEGRNLDLEEALAFLQSASYRLEVLSDVTEELVRKKIANYPQEALKHIKMEPLLVSEYTARRLVCRPAYVAGAAISHFLEPVHVLGLRLGGQRSSRLVKLNIRVNAIVHMDLQKYGETAAGMGEIADRAIEEEDLDENIDKANFEDILKQHNETIEQDPLQQELLRYNVIEKRVEWEQPEQVDEENQRYDEDMVEKVKHFMNRETDWAGAGSGSDGDDDEVDGSESSRIRDYFRQEGVDIDEDDFFEFFCREALQLSKDDMEQLRAADSEEKDEDKGQGGDVGEDNATDDMEVLSNLLASLASSNSPAATLLNNLK